MYTSTPHTRVKMSHVTEALMGKEIVTIVFLSTPQTHARTTFFSTLIFVTHTENVPILRLMNREIERFIDVNIFTCVRLNIAPHTREYHVQH